jgi:hypothetical protein
VLLIVALVVVVVVFPWLFHATLKSPHSISQVSTVSQAQGVSFLPESRPVSLLCGSVRVGSTEHTYNMLYRQWGVWTGRCDGVMV